MPSSHLELWKNTASRLRQILPQQAFIRWFESIRAISFENNCICLEVPSNLYKFWLEDNYGDMLREALTSIGKRPISFRFVSVGDGALKTQEIAPPPVEKSRAPMARRDRMALNPNFTFSNFIVGPSNNYAHAGCSAVAESPGRAYNPLFIYGGTGFGKTHLMHAIGNHLLSQTRAGVVAYISTERFVNEFVDAIQNRKMMAFHKKYRDCDVLLVDDIHFLSGKEQTQEEFFNTFNTLFVAQRQIVLSSDRPASEIAGLQERLVSRFECGLTVQVLQPDEETRLAILRNKQAHSQIPIQEDALQFLAHHIKTNVRRLEGAWSKIWFASKLKGRSLTLAEVEDELRDVLIEESKQALTIETIQKRVADHYNIRFTDMTSKRRTANIAFPRQVAMFLCRTMTPASYNEIGDAFGGRDHGTVMHGCRLVEEKMKSNDGLKQAVNHLTKQLTR